MQVTIEIDDKELQQAVKDIIAKNIVSNYTTEHYSAYKKGIEQAVKETVYVEKEKLIEKCVDRATIELTKKAFPKLIDKFADMGKEAE